MNESISYAHLSVLTLCFIFCGAFVIFAVFEPEKAFRISNRLTSGFGKRNPKKNGISPREALELSNASFLKLTLKFYESDAMELVKDQAKKGRTECEVEMGTIYGAEHRIKFAERICELFRQDGYDATCTTNAVKVNWKTPPTKRADCKTLEDS